MATRSRGGGIGGLVYGLIIFVFLFLICLALAIMFYTRYAEADQQREQLAQEQSNLINQVEQDSDTYSRLKNAAGNDRTVFGQLLLERNNLLRKMLGSADMTYEQALQQVANAGVGENQPVVSVLDQLRARVNGLQEQVDQFKAMEERLRSDLASMRQNYRNLEQSQQQELTQRKNEIADLRQRVEQFESQSDQQLSQLTGQWQSDRQDWQQQRRELEQTIEDLRTQLAIRDRRIGELENMIEEFRPVGPKMVLEHDGTVVSVVPEDNVVYINLGRQDRIILGMPFELYDADSGVDVERMGETGPIRVRGKATVEVVRVAESTAACRIVRLSRGQIVQTGDLVTNIAYDRNRVFKFFVYGSFDLDYDGMTSLADYDQVVAMIRQWGGEVAEGDEMPLDTDFLVLGMEPEMPRSLRPDATPAEIEEYERKIAAFRSYNRLGNMAADLKIPLLNQNRLLTLMGHTGR